MYPSIKATEILSAEGFSYTLRNEEIEIESDLRVPKGLRKGEPFSWAKGLCVLKIPGKGRSILRISRGYEWDGISIFEEIVERGAPVDLLRTLNRRTLVATIHHDAIYEALRDGVIPPDAADWEATYKWADNVQMEILKNQRKLNPTEQILWGYHLKKAEGASARPRR